MLIFGLGYSATRVAERAQAAGWTVDATGSAGNVAFEAAGSVLAQADLVLSSVPPADGDPVLERYGPQLAGKTLVYLSSTGVYGDADGAWVDESAPLNGRRGGRIEADLAWQPLDARVLRLPGIYGPRRSVLDRLAEGRAHRVDLPDQVFSRIHVDDIASAAMLAFAAPPGVYNIADDFPVSQNDVVEEGARLLGCPPPPYVPLEQLNPAAGAFYAENRRVANGRAKRVLGWRPRYADFVAGLGAIRAMSSPANTSTPPAAASQVQR